MSNIILKTNNISKQYGAQKVLDNVSLSINKGDIYGFVGENGAGKTTIIRVITGLIKQDGGEYELFGVSSSDQANLCKVKSKMSAIVESPSIFANFNALDNILLNQSIIGKKDLEKAKELLKLVGLDSVAVNKKAGNFSLGMRQRLGIAMCLSTDPEFLILDEPLNGLDPAGIVEIRELILKLNKEKGITFMISSHILTELNLVANRYGIISHGKLVKEITKEEIEHLGKKTSKLKTTDLNKSMDIISSIIDSNNLVTSDNEITIIGDFDITDLVVKLAEGGIKVLNISSKESSIEDFYLSVLGGTK